nr:LysM peptidoglycan-binding domain-containing protein [Neobacillus sp. Marseille-Q6967]
MAVHVVRAGESLWSISNRYGVPVQTIVSLNGLPSAVSLVPGLALYLPDNRPQVRTYRIKSGDLIWKIAEQFQTNTASILAANPGVNPNRLITGQILSIPSPVKLTISTLGFIVPTNESAVLPLLDSLSGQLTYLASVAYSFTAEGYAYNEIEDQAIIARSRQLNITPLLMIRNFTGTDFSEELAGRVLSNATYRRNLINSIVNLTRERNFGGVSIDFEFIPPPQRNDFNQFLRDLKAELNGLLLHVNVHAKTEDIPTNRIIGAYDYAAIGNAADLVAIMTIDYGYPGGPPDPIAPITWMEEVVQYSITQINPQKLQVAMALYGYDKIVGPNTTRALSLQAAQNQAITTGSPIQYDLAAKSPWYQHWLTGMHHIVWFEDIRSLIEKYHLIDVYQLNGTTFWQISLPAPQNWAYLRQDINVIK